MPDVILSYPPSLILNKTCHPNIRCSHSGILQYLGDMLGGPPHPVIVVYKEYKRTLIAVLSLIVTITGRGGHLRDM